jgi:hypothetical protein
MPLSTSILSLADNLADLLRIPEVVTVALDMTLILLSDYQRLPHLFSLLWP